MKKLILILLIIGSYLWVSCSASPSNEIVKTKKEKGDWVYDPVTKKNVQTDVTYYMLQPTWGQAFKYAAKSDNFLFYIVLSVICLFLSALIIYSQYANPSWAPKWFEKWWTVLAFVFLAAGLSSAYSSASTVRFDNDKWVTKDKYDSVMVSDGNTQAIWDEFDANCQIIGGRSCSE